MDLGASVRRLTLGGTKDGAQQYVDWFKYEFWYFVFVQQIIGKEIQTFLDYPDAAGRELQP